MNNIKILVGCEESQAVTIAFRNLEIEAYSNDILMCSGNHPEWHIQGDIFQAIEKIKPNTAKIKKCHKIIGLANQAKKLY